MVEEDLGVFPPAPPPAPKRYSVSVQRRDWSLLENLVIWPVLVDRGCKAQYDAACAWLCRTLNRVPICEPGDLLIESVNLIEMRSVTRHLDGSGLDGLVCAARRLLNGYRTGAVLSWTERCKLLPSYDNKDTNRREAIPLPDFVALLGRDESDEELISDYLDCLREGGVSLLDHGTPIDPEAARVVQQAVLYDAPNVWRKLTNLCGS